MLSYTFLPQQSLLVVEPSGPLEAKDFEGLCAEVDPYIEANGQLKGLMISTEDFPGWDGFEAFFSHMRFVKDHHQKIGKVALVSDSKVMDFLPKFVSHFVEASVKGFAGNDVDKAFMWLAE